MADAPRGPGGQPAPPDAPLFQSARPAEIHPPKRRPWNRYAYVMRRLDARVEALAGELAQGLVPRVLDFGCATTPYRRCFPAPVDYVAADLAGNPRATLVLEPDGTVPAGDESFDGVLSTQVLEHVTDPGLYLDECRRLLRPGGRLLLSTHGTLVYHPDPDDFWRWTGAGLQKAVSDAGLDVVHFEGIVGAVPTGLQLVQDALYWRVPRWFQPLLALVIQTLVRLTDRLHDDGSRRLDAMVFLLVARKPGG